MTSMSRAVRTAGRLCAVALGVAVACGGALAQDDAQVPEGATVRIKAVSPQDAYFEGRKTMVGLVCGVEAGGLHRQGKGPKWLGGSMTCDDGDNYYFYKVAVEVGAFGDYETLTGHAPGQSLPSEEPAAVEAVSGASPWPAGARVRLVDVSAEDAHVDDKATLVGKTCTVADAPLEPAGGAWYSGQLECDGGAEFYFYQVSVAAAVGAPPVATAPVVPTAAVPEFTAGKMVKIVDIAAADALYASRSTLVGRTCSVVEAPLSATGEGYYAGRLFCDDGKSYQAFKVKVAAP